MKKFFKPASLLFYMLAVLVFLLAGMTYAGISGAADGQGLAGGAILIFYGIVFALGALIASLFVVFYFSKTVIVTANRILLIILLIAIGIISYRILVKERQSSNIEEHQPKTGAELNFSTKYFE
ncbi:MAG: hypothetical protein K9H16_07035 [Bacteroidales bacterium]|nr:hypothetical protein [Bacteroidales bacterium]